MMATPGRTWAVIGLYQGRTKTGPGKGPGQDQGRTREGPGRAGPGRIREGLGRTIMDQKGPERTRTGTWKADLGPALDPDRLGKKRPRFQFFLIMEVMSHFVSFSDGNITSKYSTMKTCILLSKN
jgi:hypothetical protein